jgi:NADPH:quinone reductase-like Zn-dependent oxidoreductase
MKAIQRCARKYGSPDVLHLQEVEKLTPKDNEVFVKVHKAYEIILSAPAISVF